MSRPRSTTDDQLTKASIMVAIGFQVKEAATRLGIHPATLSRQLRDPRPPVRFELYANQLLRVTDVLEPFVA